MAQEVKQLAPGNGTQMVNWDRNPGLSDPRTVLLTLIGLSVLYCPFSPLRNLPFLLDFHNTLTWVPVARGTSLMDLFVGAWLAPPSRSLDITLPLLALLERCRQQTGQPRARDINNPLSHTPARVFPGLRSSPRLNSNASVTDVPFNRAERRNVLNVHFCACSDSWSI